MILISIIYSISCLSQNLNTDLFQTWYLSDYYSTDDNIHHPISAINPPLSPYVTFTNTKTLSFDGKGACNYFNGNFSFPSDDVLLFSDFSGTLSFCNSSDHISLENAFFSLMQSGGQYSISGEGDNMTLVISLPIFVNYVFGNSQLHSPNFDLKQAVVYPNPVDSKLFIDSQKNVIDKIEIYNSVGQTVKTINIGFDIINMSDCTSGIYLIKLHSEDKTAFKKILKQ